MGRWSGFREGPEGASQAQPPEQRQRRAGRLLSELDDRSRRRRRDHPRPHEHPSDRLEGDRGGGHQVPTGRLRGREDQRLMWPLAPRTRPGQSLRGPLGPALRHPEPRDGQGGSLRRHPPVVHRRPPPRAHFAECRTGRNAAHIGQAYSRARLGGIGPPLEMSYPQRSEWDGI